MNSDVDGMILLNFRAPFPNEMSDEDEDEDEENAVDRS